MSKSSFAASSVADDDDSYLKGFNISFSWDYPDDWCLRDVEETVFHVLDEKDVQRSESQFICNCVQSSGAGVILSQPNAESDVVPCELHFTAHPLATEFCITKVVVVSEARHLELYLDDLYEQTSKGCMLTLKKGKKAALYENEFDLSAHVQGSHKVSLKFLSLADKQSLRLQTVVVKVIRCATSNGIIPAQQRTKNGIQPSMDMNSVREMMQAMGLPVASSAEKLMNDMEQQQKQRTQMQQLMQFGLMGGNQVPVGMGQHPAIPAPQNLLASLLQQNQMVQIPPVEQMLPFLQQMQGPPPAQQNYLHNIGAACTHSLPPSLFPVSRENVPTTSSKPLRRHKSFSSMDSYDGFGTPNPPNQSALANAILNREQARQVAASKAESISEKNYEAAQMELIKKFLRSQDATRISITKRDSQFPPAKPPRRLRSPDKRRRPHSLAALPSSSELDFTKLLSHLMEQEVLSKESSDDDGSATSVSNARWEAYLRSRVRASQKLSSDKQSRPSSISNSDTEREVQSSFKDSGVYSLRNSTAMNADLDRSCCKHCGNNEVANYHDITNVILETEQRIMGRVELKLQELRHHVDLRLDSLYDAIVALHPGNFVDNNDYSDVANTAV